MVGGGQGELQCFDMGLSPLPLKKVSEEPAPDSLGTSLQLSCNMKISSGLEGIQWAGCPVSQGNEGLETHDLLLLWFHGGPLATLRLRLGQWNLCVLSVCACIFVYMSVCPGKPYSLGTKCDP